MSKFIGSQNDFEFFLKFLLGQNNQNPSFVSKPEIYMTDKMMSDQVYILISDVPMYEPLVQWYDHRR